MKNKIIQLCKVKYNFIDAIDELESNCFILFMLDKNKKGFESFNNYSKGLQAGNIGAICKTVAEGILKKKICLQVLSYKKGDYSFVLTKERYCKESKKDNIHDYWGRLFNIPKCCIKKYVEEMSDDSFNSAIRYFNQLRKLKIEDKYGVNIKDGIGVVCGMGFVPCNPLCSHAKRKLLLIKKFKKEMELISNRILKGGDSKLAISREKFEKGDFKKRATTDRKQHPIMVFLRKNHRCAWDVKEIAKHTKMNEDSVRGMLACLKKDGLVKHNPPYFIAVVNKSRKKR